MDSNLGFLILNLVFFPLLQASLKPERREREEGTASQKEGSPDQVACFHLQRIGVVLPGLLVGEGELRKRGWRLILEREAGDGSRLLEGDCGRGLVLGEMLGAGPGVGPVGKGLKGG